MVERTVRFCRILLHEVCLYLVGHEIPATVVKVHSLHPKCSPPDLVLNKVSPVRLRMYIYTHVSNFKPSLETVFVEFYF